MFRKPASNQRFQWLSEARTWGDRPPRMWLLLRGGPQGRGGHVRGRPHLLHVVMDIVPPVFYTATWKTPIFDLRSDLKNRSEEELERLLEDKPGPDVDHEVHCVEGHAAGETVRFTSEQDINLIIIPTHGLSELLQVLIGSVTKRAVRRAPCPVFTVKSFGRFLAG